MQIVTELTAAVAETADQACEDIIALIGAGGLAATGSALDRLAGLDLPADDGRAKSIIAEILTLVLDRLADDPLACESWDALALFAPAQAMDAANLLFNAHFPDGNGDLAVLPEATVLCIAGLFHAAGNTADAVQLLDKATATRQTLAFVTAAYHACHRFMGLAA